MAKDKQSCSGGSGRPLQLRSRRGHHIDGAQLPCSIEGNRFERCMHIFYSQHKRNQGKLLVCPAGLWTLLQVGESISPQRLGNLPPVMSAHLR
ncbi:hypothetical protein CN172_32055 [Sinorhizobium meliloti]|nr:hypothetical protein [Sinorhizobium meliloti]MQX92255.1 hypothetical protein [Sinorhizobium meliloti]RVE98876.1 hypothetical protein CN232_20035 [Sinorhizobium meliloti]RVH41813.1 hypothetical protein CN208_20060 [Sinorhizobium meliloti]RVK04729.1 hypothetical protein CN172_32055 [Sinorhizobium meliloti]